MNGIPSLYQMTPTGVPFRTGTRGESTSEQRYFVPGFSTTPATPLTPEQQADLALAAQRRNYDSGGGDSSTPTSPGPTSSPTMGSSGGLGGIAQSLGGAVASMQNTFGPFASAIPGYGLMNAASNIGQDLALDANARADAALAKANEQANQARVTSPYFSFGPQVTTAVDISPLGLTNTQQVSPIAPDVVAPGIPVTDLDVNVDPTAALTAMNQAQKAEEQEQSSVPAVAATVADALSFADTQDAEAGQNVGAPPGTTADQGGGGGGNDNAPGPDPGTAPSIGGSMDAAGSNNSGSEGVGSEGASPSNKQGGLIKYYNQGGVASLANQVQSQGRGQDKMLVHMTPREVQGLQYLAMRHGGSLSINPRTGLVEAGFLSSILPMVAGAALAATGVGAPMAALMVGGGYGLATGSLTKGLMAGLGAFGGAGLGAGLSAAGATASPALTGTTTGLAGAPELASQTLSQAAPQAIELSGTAADAFGMYPTTPLTSSAAYTPQGLQTLAAQQQADAAMNVIATPSSTVVSPGGFGSTVKQMGTGLSNVVQGTEGARGAFMSSVGGPMGLAKYGGAAAAPILAGGFGDQSSGLPIQEQFIRPFRYGTGRQNVPYRTGERGESTAEQTYFDSRFTPVGVYKAGTEPAYGTYAQGGTIDPDYNMEVDRNSGFSDDFYGGGLTALAAGGSPNKPRFLMGKGDGMSDSIPATINDTQPARLADGEFVIPADVVSHLGNGSSKAGAAKLHSMMNRIRKARTGKNRQAPEVRAERYMPA